MEIWKFIEDQLAAGHRVMLITVAGVRGSTPGRQGYKMAVSESGGLSGSVGGGIMEFNLVNLARERLKEGSMDPFIVRQVHNPKAGADSSGLICSGEQANLFYPLDAAYSELVSAVNTVLKAGKTGRLYMYPDYFGFDPFELSQNRIDWSLQSETEWEYTEDFGLRPTLYIFGGGHLSLALSQVFRMLDFRVVVYDDRNGLNTMENNPFAQEKSVVDYNRAAELVSPGDYSYVAIMTVSHASDQLILQQMLPLKLKYLGMIGSKKKVQSIFDALRVLGAGDDQLARVDSPMGMPINSQTVPEIAISIAARIIFIKNI